MPKNHTTQQNHEGVYSLEDFSEGMTIEFWDSKKERERTGRITSLPPWVKPMGSQNSTDLCVNIGGLEIAVAAEDVTDILKTP